MNIIRKIFGIADLKCDDKLQEKVMSYPITDWDFSHNNSKHLFDVTLKHKTKLVEVRYYSNGNPMGYSYGGNIKVDGKTESMYSDELYHSHPVGKYFGRVMDYCLAEEKAKDIARANEVAEKI